MDRRPPLALAALAVLGAAAYLARGGDPREPPAPKRRDAPAAADAPAAPAVALVTPPDRARVGEGDDDAAVAPRPDPAPAAADPRAAGRDREAPIVVTLYQHATHDPEFPGERWLVGEGRTEAGPVFRADEASAIDVPNGVVVTLLDAPVLADRQGPLTRLGPLGGPDRVEVGAGLHNLAPYGFNDRVDVVEVRRVAPEGARDAAAFPAHVTLTERSDGLASRLGRAWTLRVPAGAATRLFAARAGDYEEGAPRGLWVPERHEALLFAEPDGRGPAFALGPGLYDLERLGLAQRARSVRVLRVEHGSSR